MAGKAPHVKLIDHQVAHLPAGLRHVSPVEIVLHHPGPVCTARLLLFPPDALSGHGLGVGVQKNLIPVKQQSRSGIIGSVHPVSVLEFPDIQAKHDHGVHVADFVLLRERKHGVGILLPPIKQQQLACGSRVGVHRKIHAVLQKGGAVHIIQTRTHRKTSDFPQRQHRNRNALCGFLIDYLQ